MMSEILTPRIHRTRRPAAADRGDAGFTLVETVMAFAILALMLTALLGGLSQMTTGGRRAALMRDALVLAQARIDGLGVIEPLAPGDSSGRFDNGAAWRLHIGELRKSPPAARVAGAWVEITVSAGADATAPTVSLTSFKLIGASRP